MNDCEVRVANRMFHYMRAIDSALRARGVESRKKLIPLMKHDDRFVRYYAAQYLLGLVSERARGIIEWNHKYWFDYVAGDAGMTLSNLDSGFYKPD